MANTSTTDVLVIGAGPGGYTAAFLAADLGLNVTLVDPEENPGGVCLYRGCIPTKVLLHVVKVRMEATAASEWGITFTAPEIDLQKINAWKDNVVKKLTGGLGQLVKQRKITYIQGKARFVDSQTVEITNDQDDPQTVGFTNAIIATGSEALRLPNIDLQSPRLLDPAAALRLKDIPERLLVIGAGYIGLEMSSIYLGLDAKVTIVEMMPDLMPDADQDIIAAFKKRNAQRFEAVMVNTKVAAIEEVNQGLQVRFDGEDLEKEEDTFDKVLYAIGRQPLTDDLGLENTQVETNDQGFITVDLQRKTTDNAIYAIGDVTGPPLLAHKASHEGRVAAEAIAGHKTAFEPNVIPAVEYTDPEVAWCGLTENQAKEEGRQVEVAKFPWAASGRAATLGRSDGLTKLLIDPDTERILGAGIVGPDAGKLISEAALAIEMAAVAKDLALTIHPHPTLSETLMEAAEAFYGTCTHIYRPKKQ
ncbi:dihydrolipoyl dehydrogenase [candidate division KSB3 bacterium]|uniref:Dihydrolipoyl dehydrogenase n=1 Tax=candidate division KSB3 bacterium TaxID=2044937 RepID=A0A9D5K0A2_9BACT|nr:dihydrolipoyl dehydrogenase [candidate division KSB3 bacterium]MBD3327408.1 dihydrolipoyl dehydrogenase [candidate division KSB3 bacterium]